MNPASALLLATLMLQSSGQARDAPPTAVTHKLQSLAGSDSRDCGVVALHDKPDAAIACAKQAMASGNAYRLAIQFQGTDSIVWQGAARNAQGKLWSLFYDPGPASGPDAGKTLSVVLCREIVFATEGDDVIVCKPTLGQP